MTLPLAIFWGLVGWCGTPWPRRWPFPPPPPPDPWWFIIQIAGVIGGIIGGWAFNQAWAVGTDPVSVVASGVGALIGSVLVTDIVSLGMRSSRQVAAER
jgi:hypothetical protein